MRSTTLGICTVLLLAGAAGAVTHSALAARPLRAADSRTFQTLLGGLGLGPATDLSDCERDFDLRIGAACAQRTGTIPGAGAFCGHGNSHGPSLGPWDGAGLAR